MSIQKTIADRIREYSDTFGAAFHAKDPTLLRPYCHTPSMAIGSGRAVVADTQADDDARWARALAALPDDYHHSVLHEVEVMMTGPKSAVVTVDCGRFRESGEELSLIHI